MTAPLVPQGMIGIRHVSLFVKEFEKAIDFYTRVVGMHVEWQPDAENAYLSNQGDLLALHKTEDAADPSQRLDHIGFMLTTTQAVDDWYKHMQSHQVRITEAPKLHRDDSYGFYCLDSVGNLLEFIYHPPISQRIA